MFKMIKKVYHSKLFRQISIRSFLASMNQVYLQPSEASAAQSGFNIQCRWIYSLISVIASKV